MAAACQEAAYKLRVGCGDEGASCGIFQFHGSHVKRLIKMGADPNNPRGDWRIGARYWLKLVKKQLKIVRRDCKKRKHGYPSRAEYHWASANKTATWKYKCRVKGKCRERSKAGKCVKWYCKSQAARCSIPPWKWKGSGKHRRQETKHWNRKREWHRSAEAIQSASLR